MNHIYLTCISYVYDKSFIIIIILCILFVTKSIAYDKKLISSRIIWDLD